MTSRIEQWLKWIYQYSLLLIAFFLPVHTRFTNVFVITALLSWLIVNRFRFSFPDRKLLIRFLCFTALYLCYAIGMIYTSDQSFGWQLMQLRSSMVLLPLIFLSDSKIETPPWKEILKWFVNEGDTINEFDPLCEVQTDKATLPITSRYTGKVVKLHYKGN